MSLVYLDISNEIRKHSKKQKIDFYYKSKQKIDFDDSNLDENIRNRINTWIEDIYDSVTLEYSSIITKRLIELLKKEEKIISFIAEVFSFFLEENNIKISKQKAENI
jgi:hypothetical protein